MRLNIITKTKAKKSGVVQLTDTTYEVSVTAAPVGGKANEAIIEVLADHFHIHKNQVSIASGFTSKNKVVNLEK